MADHEDGPDRDQILKAYLSLSDGEREIMRMWNEHRSIDGDIPRSAVAASIASFIDRKGTEIWELNLYYPLLTLLEHLRFEGLISTERKREMILKIRVSYVVLHEMQTYI